MTQQQQFWLAATICSAVGMWLMLPQGGVRSRRLGTLFAAVGLGLFAWQMPRLADLAVESVFTPLAAITVIACAASITARNPVYTAIWFGVALLATAGLLMLQGAQFLGMATIVVYAGAILVTFLFVLMLAQPEGHAYYDRVGWKTSIPVLSGTLLSSLCGAALVGMLIVTISQALEEPQALENLQTHEESHLVKTELPETQLEPAAALLERAHSDTGHSDMGNFSEAPLSEAATAGRTALEANVLGGEHVARLGARLFSRHLLAIEVAGTLLLAALVGAISIVAQGKLSRDDPRSTPPGEAHHG